MTHIEEVMGVATTPTVIHFSPSQTTLTFLSLFTLNPTYTGLSDSLDIDNAKKKHVTRLMVVSLIIFSNKINGLELTRYSERLKG